MYYCTLQLTMIAINYLLVAVLSELLIRYGEAQWFGIVPPLPVTGICLLYMILYYHDRCETVPGRRKCSYF